MVEMGNTRIESLGFSVEARYRTAMSLGISAEIDIVLIQSILRREHVLRIMLT